MLGVPFKTFFLSQRRPKSRMKASKNYLNAYVETNDSISAPLRNCCNVSTHVTTLFFVEV